MSISQDIRFAFRSWRKNPVVTLAAFFALAVGMGASTAIFSVVNGVLIRPLPVKDPDRVVQVFQPAGHRSNNSVSMQDVVDWKRSLDSFEALAVYRPWSANMTGADGAIIVSTLQCDADVFRIFGVSPFRGRALSPEENQPGHDQAAILSYAFWQSHFGGREVIGKTFRLDDRARVIVGILPQHFNVLGAYDLWTPVTFDFSEKRNTRGFHAYSALGLLRPGVSLMSANAELARAAANLAITYPKQNKGVGAVAVSLRDSLTGDVKTPLLLLMAAVLAVLLIACGNVANLLMARSSSRAREISIRIAVGAQRTRLFQQLLTESLLLAVCSALTGVALAALAIQVVKRLPSTRIPRPEEITLDWRVLLFTLLITAAAGIVFGFVPALRASAFDINHTLKQAGGRVSDSRPQQRFRRLFIVAETAIATLLLIQSVLLIKSFQNAVRIEPGFETDHLATIYMSLPPRIYAEDSDPGALFAEQVLRGIRVLPGVQSAAFTADLPFSNRFAGGAVLVDGRPASKNLWDSAFVEFTAVTAGYAQTLKVPLRRGRDLTAADNVPGGKALLINDTFARHFFPGENPIGKRVSYVATDRPDWHEIVGVIADVRQQAVDRPIMPELFIPLYARVCLWPALIARTAGDPLTYMKAFRAQIQQVDPQVPTFLPRSMDQIIAEQLGWRAFNTSLLTAFASIALTLSAVGIYAVVAYSVTQRTSEIGVRMACGAAPEEIVVMILRQGLLPAVIGTVTGALGALWLTKQFSAMLFEVRFTDFTTYILAALLLIAVAAAASYFPARRAAGIDPLRALRYE